MNGLLSALRTVGAMTVNGVWRLGFATRFLFAVLMHSGQSLRRVHLTIREIYFSGVLSLLIIVVSGLFVGLVLGLQGYDILQRYGWWRCRCCASSARWSPACCSPAAPVRRSPPRSA